MSLPNTQETVEMRLDKTGDCWLWVGAIQSKGYGMVSWHGTRMLVHRLMYTWYKGEIPSDLEIDHLCFTRDCANPDHLEAVTSQVNMARNINATSETCRRGHTDRYLSSVGHRVCRTCKQETNRQWRERQV